MGIPQDKFEDLETELAAIINILMEMLCQQEDAEDAVAITKGIECYAEQVHRVGSVAGTAGLIGLQDACELFNKNLVDLCKRAISLGDSERELLEEWPTLIMGYLMAPDDHQTSEAIIEHLRNTSWGLPIAEPDTDMLRSLLLVPGMGVAELSNGTIPDGKGSDSELQLTPVDLQMADEPLAEVVEPGAETGEVVEELADDDIECELQGSSVDLQMADEPLAEVVEPGAETGEVVEELADDDIEDGLQGILAEIQLSEEVAHGGLNLDNTATSYQEESLSDDDTKDENESLTSKDSDSLCPVAEIADNKADSVYMTPAIKELIEILCAEISQLSDFVQENFHVSTIKDENITDQNELLINYAEQIECFSSACEAVGFTGLQQALAHIHINLLTYSTLGRFMTAVECAVITDWMTHALRYLRSLPDKNACEALVEYLQNDQWPAPLQPESAMALVELLMSPDIIVNQAEVEVRQRHAQPEDVSLELPEDVNPELLDSLLQELPRQTAEFSASVQRFVSGEGTLEHVELAQRVAHTLKGAANTVGVKGIAFLTHQIEDILQVLSKHTVLPSRSLANVLMNAADCLETMSEALLGMASPPAQALDVVQEVLDWANRIDQDGMAAVLETSEVEANKNFQLDCNNEYQPNQANESEQHDQIEASQIDSLQVPSSATPMLRVPAQLVDDLLRLVGESMTLNGQIQERVRKTMLHVQALRVQHLAFQQLTADLEELIDIQNVLSPFNRPIPEMDFDPLEFDQYNELHSTSRRLVEAVTDSQEVNREIREDLAALDTLLVNQLRLHRESQETVLRTRMVPVKTIVPRLQRSVRQTCRLTDKEVELRVNGTDTLIDSNVLTDMVDPLMHVIRNAIDHGIEYPEVRRTLSKNPVGRIDLKFAREGKNIIVSCRDDGAGLDMEAIRRTAERRGLIEPTQVLEEDELSRLILMPGFTTRTETTQTSGRGIGLDVVYSRLKEIKGSLQIRSTKGKGCIIELRLPVTLISTHALLVRVGQQKYAISDRGIEQILYSGSGKINRMGNTLTFQMGKEIFEMSYLKSLLNLPIDPQETGPIILVREESGATRAVVVPEIIDSRDLVVKDMGRYIPKLRAVVGAAILGDGSIAPVLDLPEFLRSPTQISKTSVGERLMSANAIVTAQRRRALVVDDSLSARRSLAQFMEDVGFEVRTARDGLEAISIIKDKRPDVLLVDLEMPRMNGLELTSYVRANNDTDDLPVIMITSRSTEKHRREAKAAGVDIYLTKPFPEEQLLQHINAVLECA